MHAAYSKIDLPPTLIQSIHPMTPGMKDVVATT
jgi:hypothetical protein